MHWIGKLWRIDGQSPNSLMFSPPILRYTVNNNRYILVIYHMYKNKSPNIIILSYRPNFRSCIIAILGLKSMTYICDAQNKLFTLLALTQNSVIQLIY